MTMKGATLCLFISLLWAAQTHPFSSYLEQVTRPQHPVDPRCLTNVHIDFNSNEYVPVYPTSTAEGLLSLSDIKKDDVVGMGAFSYVYRSAHRITGKEYAMKIQTYPTPDAHVSFNRIRREECAMNMIHFPELIVKHHATFNNTPPSKTYIIMELIDGSTMTQWLRKNKPDIETLRKWTASLVIALHALHLQGLTYSDLKETNIMVTRDGRLKLIDFGLTRRSRSCEAGRAYPVGSPENWPPEFFPNYVDKCYSDPQLDWWALGMLLARLVTGKSCLWDLTRVNSILDRAVRCHDLGKIISRGFDLTSCINDPETGALIDFIRQLTDPQSTLRIGYSEADVISQCEAQPWLAPLGSITEFFNHHILAA